MKCPVCFREMERFDSNHWRCEEHLIFNDTYCQGFWKGYEKAHKLQQDQKIVVLCGSSRFADVMAVCAWLLEKEEGVICLGLHLLPWWYATKDEIPDHLAEHEGVADRMNELHLRKIDLAHEIFVINVNDYIGDDTKREIEYTKGKGLPIRWYSHDPIGIKVQQIITSRLEEVGYEKSTD